MNALREICNSHGIQVHTRDKEYKHSILYWAAIKQLIVYSNATEWDMECFSKCLQEEMHK